MHVSAELQSGLKVCHFGPTHSLGVATELILFLVE